MDRLDLFIATGNRALTQIELIINNFFTLFASIFAPSDTGWFRMLCRVILRNDFLLISVSLLILGFVIGILKRLITI